MAFITQYCRLMVVEVPETRFLDIAYQQPYWLLTRINGFELLAQILI
jgi:hypothetical protein